jgi:hypothetical protein
MCRISERRREEIKSNMREIENVYSPTTTGLQGWKMQRKKSIKAYIIKRHMKTLKMYAVSAGKTACKN